jgi:hypothetical protein
MLLRTLAATPAALGHQLGPGGVMDRAIHSAASKQ